MLKKYKDYVCPVCWLPVTKCTCAMQPWNLIMIDAPIQKAIKILNENGLKTKFCCAGHYKGPNNFVEIQVMFQQRVTDAPIGWQIGWGNTNIWFDFYPKDREDFHSIQEKEIDNLISWAIARGK